jgi:hypothetical protein
MRHLRFPLYAVLFLCGTAAAPWLPGSRAGAYWEGEATSQEALSDGVITQVAAGVSEEQFKTGSARFDSEWVFGTSMMAAVGLAQVAKQHPERKDEHLPAIRAAVDAMLAPEGHRFDTDAWGEDPLAVLDGDRGHVAFLGYLGLAMSLERELDPEGPHAELHDRVIDALVRRFEAHPGRAVETYPDERYPVDNAAGIAAIALAGGHEDVVQAWIRTCRARWIDPETGLLYQNVTDDGHGWPRGSGTMLAAFFLGYADPSLSKELFEAGKRELVGTTIGWTALREYPRGVDKPGDIDSGPLVAGYSISATGFAVGAARMHGDEELYARLVATAELFGAPANTNEGMRWVTGGPLGDAILLAMLTAPRLP